MAKKKAKEKAASEASRVKLAEGGTGEREACRQRIAYPPLDYTCQRAVNSMSLSSLGCLGVIVM